MVFMFSCSWVAVVLLTNFNDAQLCMSVLVISDKISGLIVDLKLRKHKCPNDS